MTSEYITGYHFTGPTLRNGDAIPPLGVWITCSGPIKPCENGLHASEHPFDALNYAPGNLLHRVELRGDLVSNGNPVDKWAGRERRITASINAAPLLREFVRWCARSVLHLWTAPDVVRRYLETGDESLRAAARDVARDSARDSTWDAAWDSVWDAARDAAWDSARDAAYAGAMDAQRTEFARVMRQTFTTTKETEGLV